MDVDAKIAALEARALKAEIRRDYAAEARALKAELAEDDRLRELAALRWQVLGRDRAEALKAAVLNDPQVQIRAQLGAIVGPIKYPELFANAAAYRAEQVRKRDQAAREGIVASAARFGHSGRGTSPLDRLRRWAAKGSTKAADLLAEVVQRQGRRTNTAIVASGYRPSWKVTETREGHKRAEWSVFRPDGRVITHVRWKPYGTTTWLTPRQWAQRQEAARQRKRALARMSYAVGSARR